MFIAAVKCEATLHNDPEGCETMTSSCIKVEPTLTKTTNRESANCETVIDLLDSDSDSIFSEVLPSVRNAADIYAVSDSSDSDSQSQSTSAPCQQSSVQSSNHLVGM